MRRSIFGCSAFLLAALIVPSASSGQVQVGVGAGPSFPVGEIVDDGAQLGFHVQASLALTELPVQLRADGIFQQFPEEGDGWFRGVGGLLNVFLPLPMDALTPYIISGLGLMRVTDEHGHVAPATEFTFGLGAGVRFGLLGRSGFLEARYLDAGEEHRGIPITLGVLF